MHGAVEAPAIPPSPKWAFTRLTRALAWASQTVCNSNNACWMNSVPMPCGPTGHTCATRMDRSHMCHPHGQRCYGRQPLLEDHRVPQLALNLGRPMPLIGARPSVGAPG